MDLNGEAEYDMELNGRYTGLQSPSISGNRGTYELLQITRLQLRVCASNLTTSSQGTMVNMVYQELRSDLLWKAACFMHKFGMTVSLIMIQYLLSIDPVACAVVHSFLSLIWPAQHAFVSSSTVNLCLGCTGQKKRKANLFQNQLWIQTGLKPDVVKFSLGANRAGDAYNKSETASILQDHFYDAVYDQTRSASHAPHDKQRMTHNALHDIQHIACPSV
eukprot:1155396-Pelagomonas_calceolata.AAC.3